MRTFHRIAALSLVSLSALATFDAIAATGSTDIYAPYGVAISFGKSSGTAQAGRYNGSTDIYGVKGIAASFGQSGPLAPRESATRPGSTDIYGVDGFSASFGAPEPRAAAGPTLAR